MIVVCKELINPNTGMHEESSPWLTVGKQYHVLQVYMGHGDRILKYRLESDDNRSPTMHHAELFDVVSSQLPSNWVIKNSMGSALELGPKAWDVDGFWIAYFDGESWARELYANEVAKIVAEDARA